MKNAVVLLDSGELEIPSGLRDLPSFREWVHSPEFPETGRFDWLEGRVEVEVAPEDLDTHGTPKSTIATRLGQLIQEPERGHVFIDRARLTCPAAALSVEPDVVVLLEESLASGRAHLVPRAGETDRFIEIEGAVDLIVECVSDGSARKDLVRLRELYHRARIPEYWIVDARQDPIRFEVLLNVQEGYVEAEKSADGFRRSPLLAADVRFVLSTTKRALRFYRLDVR